MQTKPTVLNWHPLLRGLMVKAEVPTPRASEYDACISNPALTEFDRYVLTSPMAKWAMLDKANKTEDGALVVLDEVAALPSSEAVKKAAEAMVKFDPNADVPQ